MKRVIALMLLSMFSVAMLSGCNTVAGAGKDVQKAGETVEGAAKGNGSNGSVVNGKGRDFPAFFMSGG